MAMLEINTLEIPQVNPSGELSPQSWSPSALLVSSSISLCPRLHRLQHITIRDYISQTQHVRITFAFHLLENKSVKIPDYNYSNVCLYEMKINTDAVHFVTDIQILK